MLSQGALGDRLASFKIWRRDGRVLYALDRTMIGRKFPPTDALRDAWNGTVVAELDELADEESANERAEDVPLLEIYSPIREPWSGEVVAVAEFYEIATEIKADLCGGAARKLAARRGRWPRRRWRCCRASSFAAAARSSASGRR